MESFDATVVGAGPNGLAAAIVLARAGLSTVILEGNDTIGGGARSAELTLPGFIHDICSAIHPMAVVSPFMRTLPLAEHGLEWRYSPAAIAHPLDDGTAAVLDESLEETAQKLGADGDAWRRLMKPLAAHPDDRFYEILRPLPSGPRHPSLIPRF